MSVDPVYFQDDWLKDGPAAVTADLVRVGPALAGHKGNQALGILRYLRSHSSKDGKSPISRADDDAAYRYGRLLIGRAVRTYSDFGDRVFLDHLERLTVLETRTIFDGGTVVDAVFFEGQERVASLTYMPRQIKHVQKIEKTGKDVEMLLDDGTLISLHVEEAHRRRGIGTFVLRQAMSGGCRHAPAPPPGGETLWGHHGSRNEDGTYDLIRVSWPKCRPLSAPGDAASPSTPRAP
jgi:GNAT superfamily N-acetyltransferase